MYWTANPHGAYPVWIRLENTVSWTYIGGNMASSGADGGWPNGIPVLASNSGGFTFWFPQSTPTQDGFAFDAQYTYDGGMAKSTSQIP